MRQLKWILQKYCEQRCSSNCCSGIWDETIKKVNKITGPGNEYVAEAKRQVFGQVGIDSVAGPSEVLLISDKTMPEKIVALDLLAQVEHDRKMRNRS